MKAEHEYIDTGGFLEDGTKVEPGTWLTPEGVRVLAPMLAELFAAAIAAEGGKD